MDRPVHFTIQKEIQSDQLVITVKNIHTQEYFSLLPYSGARLRELHLSNGAKVISILKNIKDPVSFDRDEIFTNAKLSPFAGRISNGSYKIENSSYQLPLNYPEENNACHGFVYDKKFNGLETDIQDDRAVCSLKYEYDKLTVGFPFTYSIVLKYTLTTAGDFICETKVTNHSESAIPLSDGWHHYFDLGETVNDLKLGLETSELMELDGRNIPTGRKIPFLHYDEPKKIGEQFFDSCFCVYGHHGKSSTRLISEANGIDLEVWQETGFQKYNYLVIYTPPDRQSIAIEPMSSNVNAFNNKEDLIMLEPESEITLRFGITMRKI